MFSGKDRQQPDKTDRAVFGKPLNPRKVDSRTREQRRQDGLRALAAGAENAQRRAALFGERGRQGVKRQPVSGWRDNDGLLILNVKGKQIVSASRAIRALNPSLGATTDERSKALGNVIHSRAQEMLSRSDLFGPDILDDEAEVRRLASDPELLEIAAPPAQPGLFVTAVINVAAVARGVVNIVRTIQRFSQGPKQYEEGIVIPIDDNTLFYTRTDVSDGDEQRFDIKSSKQKGGDARTYLTLLEMANSAREDSVPAGIRRWVNGQPVIERVQLSKKTLAQLRLRENPKSYIVSPSGAQKAGDFLVSNFEATKDELGRGAQLAARKMGTRGRK